MKMSLRKAHASMEIAPQYLWSVKFMSEEQPNVLDSGLVVGKVIPALSVSESLFKMSYDTVHVGPGIELKFPKEIFYLGDVSITFYDKEKLDIHNFLLKWAQNIHNDDQGFKDLESTAFMKKLMVSKYDRQGTSPIFESIYHVGLPDSLEFKGSQESEAMENQVQFPILRVEKKHF
jgi:hypothetical protein